MTSWRFVRFRPGRATPAAFCATVLVALTLGAAPSVDARSRPGGDVSSPGPSSTAARVAAGAVAAPARPARTFGVTMPNLPGDLRGVASLAHATGHRPGVVMWYEAWSRRTGFPTAGATRVRATGATPEITWEPWQPGAGPVQPAYSLARIARGDYDAYLRSWARGIKAWGHPVRLRLAQEMNGNWYPWAEGVNGNRSGSFVAAWRHVHQVFAAQKVTGVTWVWSPNVPFPGSTDLARVFPGDAYVSEVALDGYNWSTLQQGSSWTSFAGVFGPGLKRLGTLSKRPVSIGEVGCPELGGDKAAWLAGMWRTLASWPQVRGLMWFDFDKEADWRLESSSRSLTAYVSGVGHYLAG